MDNPEIPRLRAKGSKHSQRLVVVRSCDGAHFRSADSNTLLEVLSGTELEFDEDVAYFKKGVLTRTYLQVVTFVRYDERDPPRHEMLRLNKPFWLIPVVDLKEGQKARVLHKAMPIREHKRT